MGKRSNFKRVERDFYPTPVEAVKPLIPHLVDCSSYIEPCAGNGALRQNISVLSGIQCKRMFDIEPRGLSIIKKDALTLTKEDCQGANYIITNPPWSRDILHSMIIHFTNLRYPTWLLFDADWMHTKQAIPYLKHCEKIVSIGRVKWIPGSKYTGKDNCAWYLFRNFEVETKFYGRI